MKKLNLEEIKKVVEMLDEEEFEYLKDAVSERNLKEQGLPLGPIDPNNRVVDSEEIIINGHTFLYGQKQIDALLSEYDEEIKQSQEKPVQKARGLWEY